MEKTNNATKFSDLDNKQKAEKIGKIALKVTLFIAKWTLFIVIGLTIIMAIMLFNLFQSALGMDEASQRQRERKSLAREIAKHMPRY